MLDVINFNMSICIHVLLDWGNIQLIGGWPFIETNNACKISVKFFVDVSYSELVEIILVGYDFFELPLCLCDIDRATVGL